MGARLTSALPWPEAWVLGALGRGCGACGGQGGGPVWPGRRGLHPGES